MTTTNEPSLIHEQYGARTVALLWARGIRSLSPPSAKEEEEEEVYLFSDATGRRVATALRFRLGADSWQSAFTRGDLGLCDNFDALPGAFVAVETCAFGAAKVLLEAHQARAFLCPTRWTTPMVEDALAEFAAHDRGLSADPAFEALRSAPDAPEARRAFMDALARRSTLCADVRQQVARCAAPQPPLLVRCVVAAESLSTASLDGHLAAKRALLPYLLHADPRIAKLALGRRVWWPLVGRRWAEEALDLWSVVLARRLQLARHPDLAYSFLMLQRTLHCEVSARDDLWAVQIVPPPSSAAADEQPTPLDWLRRPNMGQMWDHIEREAPSRKLGCANVLTASLLMYPCEVQVDLDAQAWLTAIGWIAWLDAALPGPGSVLAPPVLPAAMVKAVRTAGAAEVRAWARRLTDGLRPGEDPARSSTGASGSGT
jgi:hypothetical protein